MYVIPTDCFSSFTARWLSYQVIIQSEILKNLKTDSVPSNVDGIKTQAKLVVLNLFLTWPPFRSRKKFMLLPLHNYYKYESLTVTEESPDIKGFKLNFREMKISMSKLGPSPPFGEPLG